MGGGVSDCVFRVLTGFTLFDLAAFGPTMLGVFGVYIRYLGNGGLGFRPDGDSLFFKRQKK
jgi:hypothetical protein